jgi:hypothetical protein
MAKKEEIKTNANENKTEITESKPICGIIMPISAIDSYSSEHWAEVKRIISEAVNDAGYKPNLVSNADDIGIIQKRIIQNLYDNDIVVCDVSGKNPNVMFELGLRLAFDKPAIIIIDDNTDYSFDTSPIEHLSYPRDLRYFDILKFKDQLKTKIVATVEKAKNDSNYTTFLKNFGEFEVAHVEKKEGTLNDVVLSRIEEISYHISRLERRIDTGEINIIESERIKELIRRRISEFCAKNDTTIRMLKEDSTLWSDKLYEYMEESDELRHLCRYPERLRTYLELIVSQL